MSGIRLIKGKYGSICERKNSRHSSAWRNDGSGGDGEYGNGEDKSIRACTMGDGSVAGFGTRLMLGLVLMDVAGVSLMRDVDNGILSSSRSRRISAEDPEEPAIDCIADSIISILPSSWAIRVSDSSDL